MINPSTREKEVTFFNEDSIIKTTVLLNPIGKKLYRTSSISWLNTRLPSNKNYINAS